MTTDLFGLMVATLAGEPLPELPALPGRVHAAPIPTERDDYPERHQRELEAAAVWRALADEGSSACD